jgi:hypothetical protein
MSTFAIRNLSHTVATSSCNSPLASTN